MNAFHPMDSSMEKTLMETTKMLPDAVCVVDEHNRILFANESTFSFLGFSKQEVQQIRLVDFYPSEVQPFLELRIEHAKKYGFWRGKTIMTDKKGTKKNVSQIIISHNEKAKDSTYYSTIIQEIETLKSTEDILAEQKEQLAFVNTELQKALRSKDEFLANMSHELRTPLNAILGMTEALLDEVYGSLNPNQSHCLKIVGESGHHLLSLINDILDFAKMELGKLTLDFQPFDLKAICKGALDVIDPMAQQKKIKVSFDYDESISFIDGDGRRIKQTLINLLNNAVKFSDPGGRIGLAVRGFSSNKTIELDVWDMGIGVKEEDQEKIFEPYQQVQGSLDRNYDGSGLGLPLSQKIIELHQGVLSVESSPDEGSIFTISLPWKPQLVSLEDPPSHFQFSKDLDTSTPIRVLLAEDNAANIETFQLYLESKGFLVDTALTGMEVIKKANILKPTIVLMDIHMPEMDGLEAIEKLKSNDHTKNIPIIALTAFAMHHDKDRCLNAGADEYLSKPVRLHQLLNTIMEVLKNNHSL